MKNKKGDVAIVLLVFLSMFVCSAALFSFVTSNSKIQGVIQDSIFLDDLSIQQDVFMFYLRDLAKKSFYETYSEVSLNSENYIFPGINRDYKGESKPVFSELNSNLNSNFEDIFISKFKKNFLLMQKNEYFKDFFSSNSDLLSNLKVSFSGNDLLLDFGNLTFETKKEGKYFARSSSPKSLKIKFSDLRLHSFLEIHDAVLKCSGKDDVETEKCFSNELSFFDVFVEVVGTGESKSLFVKLFPLKANYFGKELIRFDFFI